MLDDLLERFHRGDRRALARLLTLVSRGEQIDSIRASLGDAVPAPRVVAITGSGGVGKSTLIGKVIQQLRQRDRTVAVLACDPRSPLTGGALLGDRIRMPKTAADDGVFIRSLAVPGGRQAIAEYLQEMACLLGRFGFDIVVIETVGAGQGDTAIRSAADCVVVLLQAQTGDDLQWEKAGMLEIADIVVIHKADLPGADVVEAQVREALHFPGSREVPVIQASSNTNQGIHQLVELLTQQQPQPLARETKS